MNYMIRTYELALLVPFLPEEFSTNHRFCYHNGNCQTRHSQNKLKLVEIFTQNVERVGRSHSGEEEVETICEYQGCGLQQCWCSDNSLNTSDLPWNVSRFIEVRCAAYLIFV
jgi:hypothetical protein